MLRYSLQSLNCEGNRPCGSDPPLPSALACPDKLQGCSWVKGWTPRVPGFLHS